MALIMTHCPPKTACFPLPFPLALPYLTLPPPLSPTSLGSYMQPPGLKLHEALPPVCSLVTHVPRGACSSIPLPLATLYLKSARMRGVSPGAGAWSFCSLLGPREV